MDAWVVALITSLGTLSASTGFWAFVQRRTTLSSATTKLLLGLAYDKIIQQGMSYIEQGWITKDEYEEFRKNLYEPYKACGGNGVGDRVMEEVSRLQLRSPAKYVEIVRPGEQRRGIDDGRPQT